MSQTNFEKVGEFHKVFQCPIKTIPDTTVFTQDPKLVDLRIKLIKEEFTELTDAVSQSDIVEVCDALADMMYVIYGAGHAFGINIDSIFTNECDMTSGTCCVKTDKSCSSTNCCMTTKQKYDPKFFENQTSLVFENLANIRVGFNKLCDNISITDLGKVGESLVSLLRAIYKAGAAFNMDLDRAFDIVHESNMTKACRNETEALETVEEIKKKGVYKNPKYKLSDDGKYWIVYDATNDKVLKSKYYKPADLTFVKY